MRRQVERLQRAAALVTADLARILTSEWRCEVDDQYVLAVSGLARTERVALATEVEDVDWFLPAGDSADEREEGLDPDAEEVVASEVVEVFRLFGEPWPVCAEHGDAVTACSGVWTCSGPPSHDLAVVGELRT